MWRFLSVTLRHSFQKVLWVRWIFGKALLSRQGGRGRKSVSSRRRTPGAPQLPDAINEFQLCHFGPRTRASPLDISIQPRGLILWHEMSFLVNHMIPPSNVWSMSNARNINLWSCLIQTVSFILELLQQGICATLNVNNNIGDFRKVSSAECQCFVCSHQLLQSITPRKSWTISLLCLFCHSSLNL